MANGKKNGNGTHRQKLLAIRRLVTEAADEIDGEINGSAGRSEHATWRLADALGLLSGWWPEAIGVKYPTGLGYRIVNVHRERAAQARKETT
jgi:hypothetical protein